MTMSRDRTYLVWVLTVLLLVGGCGASMPPIRFAPPGTDLAKLRAEFPLTDAERQALTPEGFRAMTQDQVDQIYLRLASGPIPDGPFRGDLLSARSRWARAHSRSGGSESCATRGAHRRAPRRVARPLVLEGKGILPLARRPAQPDRAARHPEAVHRRCGQHSEADVRR